MAVDATGVYVAVFEGTGQVISIPLDGVPDGGSPTVLANNQLSPRSIAVDATRVYFDDNQGNIWAVLK